MIWQFCVCPPIENISNQIALIALSLSWLVHRIGYIEIRRMQSKAN